ncbi:MAG: hypothetical protein WBV23_13915, partial [Desulfobaccales bacterium]
QGVAVPVVGFGCLVAQGVDGGEGVACGVVGVFPDGSGGIGLLNDVTGVVVLIKGDVAEAVLDLFFV